MGDEFFGFDMVGEEIRKLCDGCIEVWWIDNIGRMI